MDSDTAAFPKLLLVASRALFYIIFILADSILLSLFRVRSFSVVSLFSRLPNCSKEHFMFVGNIKADFDGLFFDYSIFVLFYSHLFIYHIHMFCSPIELPHTLRKGYVSKQPDFGKSTYVRT